LQENTALTESQEMMEDQVQQDQQGQLAQEVQLEIWDQREFKVLWDSLDQME